MKGAENAWEKTPCVRYSVLDLEGGDVIEQPARAFPPEDFSMTRYYLDASSGALNTATTPADAAASYDAESDEGLVAFTVRAEQPTDFVGYPKLRLWVEADGADDMDVFVFLQKLDADGQQLEQFNIPNRGPQMQEMTRKGAAILKYKGSNGRLRASMRHLDEAASTDEIPVHSFDRVEKLTQGQVISLDVDLFPVGLRLYAGEQLRLVVSGQHLLGGVMPGVGNVQPNNRGRHVIHTGGRYASYLQLPTRVSAA